MSVGTIANSPNMFEYYVSLTKQDNWSALAKPRPEIGDLSFEEPIGLKVKPSNRFNYPRISTAQSATTSDTVKLSSSAMRISSGATQNNLSDSGTSNAISSESSSAEIDSKASQTRLHSGRLQPAQSLQAYQQAEASQLAAANQAPQSVLSLLA